MNAHSIDDCRKIIDDYARNEGTTRGEMIPACNLDKIAPPTSIDMPVTVDETEQMAHRLCELSDALAAVALELNTDVQRSAPSLGNLWKRMALPNPVDSPSGGYDFKDEYFDQMITPGLWVDRGTSKMGYATYSPVVRCAVNLRDVYLFGDDSHEPTHIEIANREALMLNGESEDRRHNDRILRDFYKLQADRKEKQGEERINRTQG